MAKDAVYRRLIHSPRWLRLRRQVLTEYPLCRRCAEEGYVTAATEVHHVVPVEDGVTAWEKERLMYDPGNLRALCHGCHVAVHTEMGRCGRAVEARRRRREAESFRRRYLGDIRPRAASAPVDIRPQAASALTDRGTSGDEDEGGEFFEGEGV